MSQPAPAYRTALITGAAGGLGRELALQLARQGTAIAAIDLCADRLEALAADLARDHGRCAWAAADVVATSGMRDAVERLE
jgi:NAD(P)-dependent dehydrogenase (short-subunit alcohol dehydrogenase family)